MIREDEDDILALMGSEMYGTLTENSQSSSLSPSASKEKIALEGKRVEGKLYLNTQVTIEILRHQAVASLGQLFLSLCGSYFSSKRWIKHFESWLWSTRQCPDNQDPILPDFERRTLFCKVLTTKLQAAGASGRQARSICLQLGQYAVKEAHLLRRNISHQSRLNTIQKTMIDIGTNYKKFVLSCQGIDMEIAANYYEKLKFLYLKCHSKMDASFDMHAFILLLRYSSAQGTNHRGGGNQAAIFPHCMEALVSRFRVEGELFASPFNCYASSSFETSSSLQLSYFSAFTDTDAPFMSRGPFEMFHPSEGCFESNPPFEPIIVSNMYTHMATLLEKANASLKPLMFIVIIPCWKSSGQDITTDKTDIWETIDKSPHCSQSILLESSCHGYMEGARHSKQNQYRVSSADSSVFFLQSNEARSQWSISATDIDSLQSAFVTPRVNKVRVPKKRPQVIPTNGGQMNKQTSRPKKKQKMKIVK